MVDGVSNLNVTFGFDRRSSKGKHELTVSRHARVAGGMRHNEAPTARLESEEMYTAGDGTDVMYLYVPAKEHLWGIVKMQSSAVHAHPS